MKKARWLKWISIVLLIVLISGAILFYLKGRKESDSGTEKDIAETETVMPSETESVNIPGTENETGDFLLSGKQERETAASEKASEAAITEKENSTEDTAQSAENTSQKPSGQADGTQDDGQESGQDSAADAAQVQQEKEKTDRQYSAYVKSFDPAITQMEKGISYVIIGDNMDAFKEAIAGYYYQMGGDYNITKIRLDSIEVDDDSETRAMVTVFAKVGDTEYPKKLLVIWDKNYQFYSVYAYHTYRS